MDIKTILMEDCHYDDWYEDSERIIVTFKNKHEDDANNFMERIPYTIMVSNGFEITVLVLKEDLPWTN